MTESPTNYLYDFAAARSKPLINDRFQDVLRSVAVHQFNPHSSELSLEGATIGDWWIIRVNGRGTFQFAGPLPGDLWRSRCRITFVMSGESVTPGERNDFGRPGEVCLSRWERGDRLSHSGTFSYLAIFIPVADVDRICEDGLPYGGKMSTFSGPGAVIGTMLKSWVEEALSGQAPDMLSSVSEDFLRLLLRVFASGVLSAPSTELTATRRINKVVTYLKQNLSNSELDIIQVARECGVSERQLYRDFASEGLRFSDVLRQLRLEQAATRLVREQDERVADVSHECGFVCPAHFARVFRRRYGETPRDYRERYRARL